MSSAVTVVVLSYNGTADTLGCLDSLFRDHEGGFAVLVVDNASTDGAPSAIRTAYPDVALIELPENRGWAGGNNVGIESALRDGAELVCLLNNDTVVPQGAIRRLAETARRVGPCLLHPAIDFADPAEGAQLDPRRTMSAGSAVPLVEDPDVFTIDRAYGACLMIPAEVFRRIGRLDERFFLQLEETDFWLRASRAGIPALCDTQARILHAESRSFGGRMTPTKSYYIVRNTLLLTEKHHRTLAGLGRALRSIGWLAAKLSRGETPVLRWCLSGRPHARAMRAGVRDYVLRRFGRISAAGLRAATPVSRAGG